MCLGWGCGSSLSPSRTRIQTTLNRFDELSARGRLAGGRDFTSTLRRLNSSIVGKMAVYLSETSDVPVGP